MTTVPNLDCRTLTSVDGNEIYVQAIGNPTKPCVIFCHGMCGDTSVFDIILGRKDVQENIYAVAYDARGHGRTGRPDTEAGYESHRYAEDVQTIISAFGLHKPFFAGWSLGGAVATDLCAAKVPISGIIYFASLPYIGPIMGIVVTPLILGFVPQLQNDDAAVALKCRTEFCKLLVASSRLPNVPQRDLNAWIGAACHFTPQACRLNLVRKQDPAGLFEAGQNGLPLLIIGGTDDEQVRVEKVINHMSPHFKVCETLMLDGVGHMPFYEAPDTVTKRLLEFVQKYQPTSV